MENSNSPVGKQNPLIGVLMANNIFPCSLMQFENKNFSFCHAEFDENDNFSCRYCKSCACWDEFVNEQQEALLNAE
jgi:hypothetical protein